MKQKHYFWGIFLTGVVLAGLLWLAGTQETQALTNFDRCVCAEPVPSHEDAPESQQLASKLFKCNCGNLECVVAKGSFGGMGGRGKNYGISCVK